MRAKRLLPIALLVLMAAAASATAADEDPVAAKLYPYVVPASFFEQGGKDLARPLGHDLHVALVFDLGGTARAATSENLRSLGLPLDRAHAVALANLEQLVVDQQVKMAMIPNGPRSRPFVLFGGHWAAATSILLPNLAGSVSKSLGSQEVCASIPHREAMLVFACGDRAYRDEMRALVREKEAGAPRPLTYGLFRLNADGIRAVTE
jgi:hypothetical protein